MPHAERNIVDESVLVLNQTYEPLHICDVKRAIVLILENKATLVNSRNGRFLKTVDQIFPLPSIIRIQRYVRIKHWDAFLSRTNIFKRDNYTCQYCGAHNVPLTIDHVVPKVLGGEDTWTNLVTACLPCNNCKGNKTPHEAGLKLVNKPRKPHRVHTLQRFVDSPIDDWRPYLFLD
jgi:5-methylcytosine-specific restriction endonuclease McrA